MLARIGRDRCLAETEGSIRRISRRAQAAGERGTGWPGAAEARTETKSRGDRTGPAAPRERTPAEASGAGGVHYRFPKKMAQMFGKTLETPDLDIRVDHLDRAVGRNGGRISCLPGTGDAPQQSLSGTPGDRTTAVCEETVSPRALPPEERTEVTRC